jgi:hypothetical protein
MPEPPNPAGPPAAAPQPPKPTVENRWWVDSATAKDRRGGGSAEGSSRQAVAPIVGARLFGVGRDFDQDRARSRLTDSNLNWLREANPAENEWAYLAMIAERSPRELIERVKRAIRLPRGARGVLVDSGSSLRVIVTGKPIGERIAELTLGGDSSLDAWVQGEWVQEKPFRSRERALREASAFIARFLRSGA